MALRCSFGVVAVGACDWVVLGIRLGFHNHAPEQAAVCLAFHQQATDQGGGDRLGGACKESLGKGWEILGDGSGGYGRGCFRLFIKPSC